jgi:hypothetical protein
MCYILPDMYFLGWVAPVMKWEHKSLDVVFVSASCWRFELCAISSTAHGRLKNAAAEPVLLVSLQFRMLSRQFEKDLRTLDV